MLQLYHFTFSHYCEKARWALDYKGIPYESRPLVPGFHMRTTLKLAPQSCVPILAGDGVVVQDSTEIISFLERTFPVSPLTPDDPDQAAEALEWEEYLDEEIGVTLRRWFYFHALPDRRRSVRFLCQGANAFQRALFGPAFPRIRQAMIEMMDVYPEPSRQAEQRLMAAFDRLDAALGRHDYLVGGQFSRADLTACALLWPFCRPGESDSQVEALLPEPVRALRARSLSRRFYTWVLDTYRRHRAESPIVRRSAAL